MNKSIRLLLMICLVLGLVLVAQSQIVRANESRETTLSAKGSEKQSVAAAHPDDCEKGNGKDKKKCKGTVKPPARDILIPVTGEYSVGGFCTLSIVVTDPQVTLNASIQAPLPHDLPDKVHKVRQGCLLEYYKNNQPIDELVPAAGTTTICFAATPKEQTVIYYYDTNNSSAEWLALETTVTNGIACAPANATGIYLATFQNH